MRTFGAGDWLRRSHPGGYTPGRLGNLGEFKMRSVPEGRVNVNETASHERAGPGTVVDASRRYRIGR